MVGEVGESGRTQEGGTFSRSRGQPTGAISCTSNLKETGGSRSKMIRNDKKFDKQVHKELKILEHLLVEESEGSTKKQEFAALKIIRNDMKFEKQAGRELKTLDRLMMEGSEGSPKKQEFKKQVQRELKIL